MFNKKFAALTLAATMTLGMATTVSAATITVSNADSATLTYAQIIEEDTSSSLGWKFTSAEVASAFEKAYDVKTADEAMAAVIAENGNASADFKEALSYVSANTNITFAAMDKTQNVTKAGVYAVKGAETGYTYNNMAAYVGFTYDATGAKLDNATLNAKKAPEKTDKVVNDDNAVTEIGKTLSYTVNSNFPYIASNAENKFYGVYDKLDGASYVENSVKVYLGKNADGSDKDITSEVSVVFTDNKDGFSVDLSKYIDDANTYATIPVKVTYDATVTGTTVGNKAIFDKAKHTFDDTTGWTTVTTYTGKITLTKTGEQDAKLANAGFIVSKDVAAVEATETTEAVAAHVEYATFDEDNNFVAWVSSAAEATEVFTGTDGTVTVNGLDLGTYKFTEKTAPQGYSVNKTPVSATLKLDGDKTVADAIVVATTSMVDTKLLALPATGGIGTTIFTVLGCLLMIGAVALFFVNRRKADR